jgi:hypothetical protein
VGTLSFRGGSPLAGTTSIESMDRKWADDALQDDLVSSRGKVLSLGKGKAGPIMEKLLGSTKLRTPHIADILAMYPETPREHQHRTPRHLGGETNNENSELQNAPQSGTSASQSVDCSAESEEPAVACSVFQLPSTPEFKSLSMIQGGADPKTDRCLWFVRPCGCVCHVRIP